MIQNPYTVEALENADYPDTADGMLVGPGVRIRCTTLPIAVAWAARLNAAYRAGQESVAGVSVSKLETMLAKADEAIDAKALGKLEEDVRRTVTLIGNEQHTEEVPNG